jgi:hypothetical protein
MYNSAWPAAGREREVRVRRLLSILKHVTYKSSGCCWITAHIGSGLFRAVRSRRWTYLDEDVKGLRLQVGEMGDFNASI